MKTQIYLLTILSLSFLFGCHKEDLSEELNIDPNFRVFENKIDNYSASRSMISKEETNLTIADLEVDLIAGQNYDAGSVSVYFGCTDVKIVYSTNEEWSISATHMSIGSCDTQTMPTTNNGNPKIGKFAHSSSHSDGINEVIYVIDREALSNNFCFAAHAVVSGANGEETAWAEGEDFGGKSWGMYVEAYMSDCTGGGANELE